MTTVASMHRPGAGVPALCAALLVTLPVIVGLAPASAAAEVTSYARVLDDGTLRVGRHLMRLHGIYIPPSGRSCRTGIRPVRCATRAALALEFKIQGFVSCEERQRHADGSISALCRNDDVDLGAYLIERGWAVAGPDAPFEYGVLEEIAKRRNMGVWGFQADQVQPVTGTR